MKKILLTLGAITAVVAPIASVVACGNPTNKNTPIDTSSNDGDNSVQTAKEHKYPELTDSIYDDLVTDKYDDTGSIDVIYLLKMGKEYFEKYDKLNKDFPGDYDFKNNILWMSNYDGKLRLVPYHELYDFAHSINPDLYPYLD